MLVALFSLYPFLSAILALLAVWSVAVSASFNMFLTGVCVLFYTMIPTGSFDSWFSGTLDFVYAIFPESVERFNRNLDATFQLHETTRPERALYLWHPHGLLSLTPILHTVRKKLGKIACIPLFHDIPVVRDLYHFVGSIPSNYNSMKDALEKGSLSVIPGGTREMILSSSSKTTLVLKDRTGVFKLALETGTPIVPVLTFGEDDHFPQLDMPILRSINQWVYSRWKIAIPFFSMRSIFNWLHLADSPLPPIRSYCGNTIHVEKTDATMEKIQELKKTYQASLEALFRDKAPQGMQLEVE
jgi:hypothetical protein